MHPRPPASACEAGTPIPETLAAGRHLAVAHNYTEAQVGYLVPGGDTITDERDGRECVVVFARTTLDPEVEAAGEIELNGDWTPLSAVGQGGSAVRDAEGGLRRCQRQAHRGGGTGSALTPLALRAR